MFAIIQTGGKQFRVQNGDVIYVEKLNAEVGEEISFDVLMCEKDGEVQIGAPVLDGVKVQGKILQQGRGQKILVFNYKAKKNVRRRKGHRQPFTKVEITAIG